MVQRKVPNKLDIQADHVKSNMLLANLINKPSSPRGGGPDLTKKMKKSRPLKRSSESLRSSPSPPPRKKAAQPGKPPPLCPNKPKQSPIKSAQVSSSTILKQSPGKLLLEGSPNYMKSTSSFDARKERSQAPLLHKTPSPKKSEKAKVCSSVSSHKASRTSSLELVRTLTKTPSFKPSRASKKCSPVALCEEFDVQRATCSSTLKDSKFPDYLELDPGGTELEGTSSMKVCPYTYCSLNGHHHAPLPPLKSFLSARRRMLKTQKSFKLGCLSQQQNLEVKPAPKGHKDFFIEICSKDGGDGEIVENSDIDFGTLNENNDAVSIELDDGELSPDYWMEGVAEETTVVPQNLPGQPFFEVSDMELELKSLEIYANIKKVYDEESVGSEAWLKDFDSDADISYLHSGSDQFLNLSDNKTPDGFSSTAKEKDQIDATKTESEDRITVLEENNHGEDELNQQVSTGEAVEMDTDQIDATKSVVNIDTSNIIEGFIEADHPENDSPEKQSETKYDLEKDQEESKTFNPSNKSSASTKNFLPYVSRTSDEELLKTCTNLRIIKNKRSDEELEEGMKEFNPRDPNFLPLEPDLEGEKVDLRHQMMDERKNSEEWMVDFALQQAVTRLAKARKKKVSLLVEAFEKVTPIPKYQTHIRQPSRVFELTRTIQACS